MVAGTCNAALDTGNIYNGLNLSEIQCVYEFMNVYFDQLWPVAVYMQVNSDIPTGLTAAESLSYIVPYTFREMDL